MAESVERDEVEEGVHTSVADVWINRDNVVIMYFRAVDHHTLEDAKEVVRAHHEVAGGIRTPVLADITGVTTGANREAREYYVAEESSQLKTGMAMLVSSPLQRMIGNIFFRMNRPPYPSKLFTDREAAFAWLATL